MSDHQGRNNPKSKKLGLSPLSTALSAAFAESGIPLNPGDGAAKSSIKKPVSPPPPRAQEATSDNELFRRATEGTTPLQTIQPGNIRDRNAASHPRAILNNHEQPKRKNQSVPSKLGKKTKSQTPKTKKDIPGVVYRNGPDGHRQVVITGNWLEFGGNKNKGNKLPPQSPPLTTDLVVDGHLALLPSLCRDNNRSDFSNSHAAWCSCPLAGDASGEVELFIGLDFGTSFCKVVVQEPSRPQAWAIPFSANEHNPYTLATKLWERDGSFHLDPDGRAFSNLKMALFGEGVTPVDVIRATAFVALVIRHAKNWSWKHKADEFPGQVPLWQVNLGIPARNFENKRLVDKFKKILWAGMVLAENNGKAICIEDINQVISAVEKAWDHVDAKITVNNYGSVYRDQIAVYPEIAAQIYGFLRSEYRDPSQNTFMLVDVGGGTVDAALFHVFQKKDGETTFIFKASAVEPLGVYMLHRERIHWFLDQLSKKGLCPEIVKLLRALIANNWMPDEIPGLISQYLTGVQYPEHTSDKEFCNSFSSMLWYDIIMMAKQKAAGVETKGARTQFLLSGGGRTIALYKSFIDFINSPNSNSQLRLHPIEMGVPKALQAQHLAISEFHRLSVAYGLSFNTIGEIVTADMLKNAPINTCQVNYQNFYIGQEMM